MTTNLMAAAVRGSRATGALAAVLTLTLLLAQAAGAAPMYTTVPMAQRAAAAEKACTAGGGQATIDYTYSSSGKMITSITVSCSGGSEDGWVCVNTPSTVDCHRPLTRPEESPQLPTTGTNAPVPADNPQAPVIVGDGTYATDTATQTESQSTTGQDGIPLYAEDDQPATYPYGSQDEADEGAESPTTVEYRRIVRDDEE